MTNFNHWLILLSSGLLILSVVLLISYLLTLKDLLIKLVCIELLVNALLASIALWAIKTGAYLLIDVCLALALVMFLSTIAYCQYYLSQKVKQP